MRRLLLGLTLFIASAHRVSDRESLLAADRLLSERTATLGPLRGFLPALTDSAAVLYPGSPLLRGAEEIRGFLERGDSVAALTWAPAYADVSQDGSLGYTYGWTRSLGARGKYLACWRKTSDRWRIAAYARTTPVAVTDSVSPAATRAAPTASMRGHADRSELIRADSAFAALSIASGAKAAFLAFAAEAAMSFGAGAQITVGREAIGAAFDGFPAGAVLEWWPVGAEIASSGDLGCTVGEASIASLHHYSKYLTIWQRQPDASWKFVADGGNPRPAP